MSEKSEAAVEVSVGLFITYALMSITIYELNFLNLLQDLNTLAGVIEKHESGVIMDIQRDTDCPDGCEETRNYK